MKRFWPVCLLLFLTAATLADPKNDLQMGHNLLKDGKLPEALYCLEAASAADDFILKDIVQFDIAELYFKNRNYDMAATEYEKLPQNSTLYNEALFKRAQSLELSGKIDKALAIYQDYYANHSDDERADEAGYRLAEMYEKKKKFKDAHRIYTQVDFYYPASSYAKKSRIRLNYLTKRYRLPSYKSTPKELYKKGLAYLNSGKYDEAEAVFLRLARNFPKDKHVSQAFLLLGKAELWGGKTEKAISSIGRSLSYSSGSRKASRLYYLGRAYGRRGKYKYAVNYMSTLIAKYPTSSYADNACYYLGIYNEIEDKPASAIKNYLYLMKNYPNSPYTDDGIFRAGILYYKNQAYHSAYDVFGQAYIKSVGDETPKCLLWWGKAADKIGLTNEAAGIYYHLAGKFDHHYAAYRAREILNQRGYALPQGVNIAPNAGAAVLTVIDSDSEDDLRELEEVVGTWRATNPEITDDVALGVARYEMLMELGLAEYAALEAKKIIASGSRGKGGVEAQIRMGRMLHRSGEFRAPISFTEGKVKKAILAGKPDSVPSAFWELAYPRGFFETVRKYSLNYSLDPYLALAVIREESRFNPKALSRSRAHGLMQIIPSTGRILAKQLDIKPFYRSKMYNVDVNVKMGTKYLSDLIKRFDGNVALALAGYNGGPVRVKKWVNNWYNGDTRNLDIDEFIEYIPLRETRYYVQKVLGSYYEYKRLYEGSN